MLSAARLGSVLAQGSTSARNEALVWIGVLIGVVLVASVVILLLRRRLLGGDTAGAADVSRGLLDDLREARDRGDLTDEEFETARLKLVARISGKSVEELAAKGSPAAKAAAGRSSPRPKPGYDLTGDPLPRPASPPPPDNG